MKYVVLGASAAGISGVREIRRLDRDGEIVLISRDRAIYSRCWFFETGFLCISLAVLELTL